MPEIYCGICGNTVQPKDLFCRKCGSSLDPKNITSEPIQSTQPKLRMSSHSAAHIESEEPKRGFWLTAILALWLIINTGQVFYYLFMALTTSQTISTFYLLWMILRAGANVIFLIAIWKWKKWGVYGFLASTFLGVFILLIIGGITGTFIGTLIGAIIVAGILYFLLRNVWNQMD